ncbi:hypothetical protein LP419_38360 [Massilia sp. H-1]|nr:hypothetical protein LP419_38360 [Massilia sp. H-1]
MVMNAFGLSGLHGQLVDLLRAIDFQPGPDAGDAVDPPVQPAPCTST